MLSGLSVNLVDKGLKKPSAVFLSPPAAALEAAAILLERTFAMPLPSIRSRTKYT